MRCGIIFTVLAMLVATPAFAKGHHHHHHSAQRHYDAPRADLTSVKLDSGQIIRVATRYADRFRGFLNALYHKYGSLPDVECYSPTGHMRNSLHHGGLACDVGQEVRNKAWGPMYHITDLAEQFGLFDGCHIHNPGPDCGHVDVSNVVGAHYYGEEGHHYAPPASQHYASHHRIHYAARHYRHYRIVAQADYQPYWH